MRLPDPYSRAGILLFAVPLYAGPVLAGLSRNPGILAVVYAAVFGLLALQGRMPDLSTARGRIALGRLLLIQAALALAIYGMGRLMAWPFGRLPLPAWLPLALTLAAAVFAAWRYRTRAAPEDALLDPDLASGSEAGDDGISSEMDTQIDAILSDLTTKDPKQALGDILVEMYEGNDAYDLAAMRFLIRPGVRTATSKDDRLGMALTLGLSSDDADVRAEARDLAHSLLADDAGASAFPPPDRLKGLAKQFPDTAETLAAIGAHMAERA